MAGTLACSPAWSFDPTLLANWPQLEAHVRVNRDTLEAPWTSVVHKPYAPPDYSLESAQPKEAWNELSHAPGFIEMPVKEPAANAPQSYTRPTFALGGGSADTLRSWLRVAGINASSCIAPVMRMHSAFAGSSQRANVSVSARCSIH
jgi:hypothetical protein